MLGYETKLARSEGWPEAEQTLTEEKRIITGQIDAALVAHAAQQRRIDELEQALRPFAELSNSCGADDHLSVYVKCGHLRRAAAALARMEEERDV